MAVYNELLPKVTYIFFYFKLYLPPDSFPTRLESNVYFCYLAHSWGNGDGFIPFSMVIVRKSKWRNSAKIRTRVDGFSFRAAELHAHPANVVNWLRILGISASRIEHANSITWTHSTSSTAQHNILHLDLVSKSRSWNMLGPKRHAALIPGNKLSLLEISFW